MALIKKQRVAYAKQGVAHTATDGEVNRRKFHAIKITTITSQTDLNDSVRAGGSGDADDFWNEYFMVSVNGAVPAGEMRKVTDFANSDGGFIIASAFSATVLVGDIFAILRNVKGEELSFEPDIADIVINAFGQGFGPVPPISILQGAGASFAARVVGAEAYPAADAAIPLPPLHDLYVAAMGRFSAGTPSVVSGTAASAGTIQIATGKGANFAVGQFVAVEDVNASGLVRDEVRTIVGIEAGGGVGGTDLLHVKPDFTAVGTAGKRVYASVTYGLAADDATYPKISVEIYQPNTSANGQEIVIQNCLVNFEMGEERSNVLKVAFDVTGSEMSVNALPAGHFSRGIDKTVFDDTPTGFSAIQTVNGELSFRTTDGIGVKGASYRTTLRRASNISIQTGNDVQSDGGFGSSTGVEDTFVAGRIPAMTLTARLDGTFQDLLDQTVGVVKDVQIQLGSDKEEASVVKRSIYVAKWPNAIITATPQGDQDGTITIELAMAPTIDRQGGFDDPAFGDAGSRPVPAITDEMRFGII